jgi:hypothetical protein
MTFELKGTEGIVTVASGYRPEGEITRDTPGRFEAFVAQQDKGDRRHVEFDVAFNSPGGSLGHYARRSDTQTQISYICFRDST